MHISGGARGGCEPYTPFVSVDAGPASIVYVPQNKKKWSRAFVVGCSAFALTALVGWVLHTGQNSQSASLFETAAESKSGVMQKYKSEMGGVYYNVFTGKSVGSGFCSAGSYRRKNDAGRFSCVDCPVGQWCDYDKTNPCPDKTTTVSFGASALSQCVCKPGFFGDSPTSCNPCPAGSFCPGGSVIQACPAHSHSLAGGASCDCDEGYTGYAFSGPASLVCRRCPPNTFCSRNVLSNCTENSYAPSGSKSAADCQCAKGYYASDGICEGCEEGYFCPGKDARPQQCPGQSSSPPLSSKVSDCRCRAGFHGTDPASCVECEPGYFCVGGSNRDPGAAAPGSYFPAGSVGGSDSALCPMGYMCPGGHRDKAPCVTPGMYCPKGAVKARYCPVGYYCAGNPADGPMNKAECASDPGYYCNAGSPEHPGNVDPAGRPCPAGFYCTGGMSDKTMCTAAPGFYCAPASSTPEGVQCPAGYYCVGGSADKQQCTAALGYYCARGSASPQGVQCPAGSYCGGGASDRVSCDTAPGRYCARGGSNPKGSICPLGYYCPGGSADRTPCAAPPGGYCPEGSSTYDGSPCPVGYYCVGGTSDRAPCTAAPGKYCDVKSASPLGQDCPQGFYCAGQGTDKSPCKAQPGSYCPATTGQSISPQNGVPCDEGVYCTGGTADAQPCAAPVGRYCPRASGAKDGTLCPVGFYCNGVVRRPCTAAAGFYCPAGSSSPDGVPCLAGYQCVGGSSGLMDCPAPPGSYCPTGSASAKLCPAGSYCPGGSADASPCQSYAGSYCPAGTRNVQGVKCPQGFFCKGGGSQKEVCRASSGYYCPEGSSNPAGDAPCPENFYCLGGSQDPVACQATPGSFCPKGGASATGQPCPVGFFCSGGSGGKLPCNAPAGSYCPAGVASTEGVACPVGFYCSGGSNDKLACNAVPGKYCAPGSQFKSGSQCPAGYYCPGGSADKQTCSAPPGNYCPQGTSSASGVACDAGKYCSGGGAPPATCPSSSCPTAGLWTVRLYSVPPGTRITPLDVTQGAFIGENRVVPEIDFRGTSDFKRLVPEVGSDWFGWVFDGQLLVQQQGSYNLCITSDDGSMLYIVPSPGAVDYRLLIDDDGLHGPQQRCRALTLSSGRYPIKVTGFQAAGGVYMQARYSGPDTGGNLVSLPSADSTVPEGASPKDGWTMQIFRQPPGASVTPVVFDRNDLVGQSSLVPTVQQDARADFAMYVASCPQADYAWRFYGRVAIYTGGTYTFCTTSDDGSLFFLNLEPAGSGNAAGFQPGDDDDGFTLIIDNDGLHGPRRYCKSLTLTAGGYYAKVTGFQAGGGVMMQLTYSGPDTLGTELFVRSTNSAKPSFDKVSGGWTVQLFRIPPGTQTTPLGLAQGDLVGESAQVPVVSFDSASDFRRYVPACPDSNYAWRFYGKFRVFAAGEYTFCTTSDDGSLFYIDLTPNDKKLTYTLLIDNDGLHGARQYCKAISLAIGTYQTKVTGFQAGGGIAMVVTYKGPDTSNQWLLLRSLDSEKPTDDTAVGGWLVQLFRVAPGTELTPPFFAADALIGQSNVVPYLQFDSGRDFRVYISQCPDQYFGWRVYGKVKVTGSGEYTFCTTSDDGSLFYMDLTPSPKVSYTLLIDNDGLHGPRQYCKAVTLATGAYDVKVTGFQNEGGVALALAYKGPDTGGQWLFTRSEDSSRPADDDSKQGWALELFNIPPGTSLTPLKYSSSALVGDSKAVPAISFNSAADFRRFVQKCPEVNYAWRFYGKAAIVIPGAYTFCTASDDGSLLFMDLTPGNDLELSLIIDNDGLHGTRQYCRTLTLAAGLYQTKVTGFQAGGGISMQLRYQGPDTSGQWWFVRSVDSARPIDDESQLGWTMQLFRIGGGVGATPLSFATSNLIGEASQVPNIDFDNANEFRRYVTSCPNENFAWRFYGQVDVVTGGNYNFCTTSDDGSMLYIDLSPGDKDPSYALVINNDGLHGARQYCKTMSLQPGRYSTKLDEGQRIKGFKCSLSTWQVTGFQGPGAVVMKFYYNGPDTANQWVAVRSIDSSKPTGNS